MDKPTEPGSRGERQLQSLYGTEKRAEAFYQNQMQAELSPRMIEFISEQEMVFVSTSDAKGDCDCTFRFGPPGFVHVIDSTTLVYPEYRGNGVMASLGNILENPHIGLLFIDFYKHTIGLHVNGKASIVENASLEEDAALSAALKDALSDTSCRRPERWVKIEVDEAYIHCSKHIPLLQKLDKEIHWGTDIEAHKGGDFFSVKPVMSGSSNMRK